VPKADNLSARAKKGNTMQSSVNSLQKAQKKGAKVEIIPERRRKYLDDNPNPDYEFEANNKPDLKKLPSRIPKDARLAPIEHTRNSSVPPMMSLQPPGKGLSLGGGHPVNFAPSPSQRGGHNVRLETIDHSKYQKNKNSLSS